jgi:hypothetical protein
LSLHRAGRKLAAFSKSIRPETTLNQNHFAQLRRVLGEIIFNSHTAPMFSTNPP